MCRTGGDHLASPPPPSVWKASGLDPSFMNFMAGGRARRKHGAARPAAAVAAVLPLSLSLSLGDGVQLTTASLRLQLGVSLPSACLHFTPPPPAAGRWPSAPGLSLVALLLRAQARASTSRGRSSPKKHARGQPRTDGLFCWFGEARRLAFTTTTCPFTTTASCCCYACSSSSP